MRKSKRRLKSKHHGTKNGEACNLDQIGGDDAGWSRLLALVMLATRSFIRLDSERERLTELIKL